jgi:hypothetical protein
MPTVQPDPRFLSVSELSNQGISNYDGLTIQYRRAFSKGFQGQISYTWSHALDDVSNGGSGLQIGYNSQLFNTLANPTVAANYGNADYDVRHNVTADFVWDTPWKFSNRGLNYLLGNWTVSSKFYIRTGMPESLTDTLLPNIFQGTLNVGSTYGGLIPTAVTNIPSYCGVASVNLATPCLSQSMFLAAGTEPGFGNIGRNTLFGPGYFNIDTSLYKNIPITERVKLTIGASAYNLLNHAHFADPYPDVRSGSVGDIYLTVEEPTSAYGAFQGSVVTGRVMVLTGQLRF